MTKRELTVTDHLLGAQAILDREVVAGPELAAVRERIERALSVMQLARCDAQTALDRL
jgi:hypothetical protein